MRIIILLFLLKLLKFKVYGFEFLRSKFYSCIMMNTNIYDY